MDYILSKSEENKVLSMAELLIALWGAFTDANFLSKKIGTLHHGLVTLASSIYVKKRYVMKAKNSIKGEISACKAAGIITSVIAGYKPIIPNQQFTLNDEELIEDIYLENEKFALLCGLDFLHQIPEDQKGNIETNFLKETWVTSWFDKMTTLLFYREYSTNSLILIYETLDSIYDISYKIDKIN